MADHDLLIKQLSREATPVTRPQARNLRVLSWMLLALPCAGLSSLLVNRAANDWSAAGSWLAVVQLSLAFLVGGMAIANAFTLSIAGRKPLSWRWFALPLLLWAVGALFSLNSSPPAGHHSGEVNCYAFMLTVSAPMVVIVIAYLRRTRSLYPLRTLATAGAGVASMALTLLTFCHPVEIHPLDFLLHIAAILTIVSATIVLGWRHVVIS